jgi:pimeloyl-ACP methyl ester carboxylesterase
MHTKAPVGGERWRGGRGAPLVVLHGLGATFRVWRPILDLLAADYDVFAPTLPGHLGGAPVAGLPSATAAALADAICADLDREGIARAHVAGNSLGGLLALELARRGRALSVVALAPIGCLTAQETAALRRRLRAEQRAAALLWRAARPFVSRPLVRRLLFANAVHRPDLLPPDAARQWLTAYGCCPGFALILDALAEHPPEPWPAFDCPVCVAWPEEDRLTPLRPFADRFAAALPSAAHVRIARAGHLPMSDAPAEVAAIIRRHARTTIPV